LRETDGPPQIAGALGWVRCATAAEHPAGDHTLFVGEVTEAESGRAERALVYLDRRYVSA
jgi:flavin reductase (DIM6/NTAB) family NADH-FMN oxidoreductase RutF